MNKVELIGRLVRDPEARYTAGENPTAVTRFTIACDRRFQKDKEQTADFIGCIAFGKSAEFISKYFTKGMKIALIGHIQTGSYTNKDNQKVYTTDVIVDECEFVEKKYDGAGSSATTEEPNLDGFINVPDDAPEELPFS